VTYPDYSRAPDDQPAPRPTYSVHSGHDDPSWIDPSDRDADSPAQALVADVDDATTEGDPGAFWAYCTAVGMIAGFLVALVTR
jgi:hypothetical protein